MTDDCVEHIAGQRMMVGFDGTTLNADLKAVIRDLKVGGIILFSRNIEEPDQVRDLCRSAQAWAAACGLPPLFIAIDQEGGKVARLRPPHFAAFPAGNPGMAGPDDAARFAAVTAAELQRIGVTMNMAPVLDVEPDGFEGIMHTRVFRGDAHVVAAMGSRMIDTFQKAGIMAVAKHFPGIGRTTLDSHLDLPVLDASKALLTATDLVPFAAAVDRGVSGIMMSHIIYRDLDPDWPAGLSEVIVAGLLRSTLGYQGLVMTDDLDMKAIRVPIDTSVHRIVRAQVDLALICHQGPDIEGAFRAFVREIQSSETARAHAARSLERIMALKKAYLSGISV
ncbi:beta-N-acetylhexosaminidase [Desulfatiferula olefinivorans]